MKDPERRKKLLENYAKYSSLAIQMLAMILIGVYGGFKLDEWINTGFPVFTVLLSIVSVAGAVYYAIKDFIKGNKNKK
ncbi:MAG: AtpZ/AtpI family protein [Bacteroidales bacterium]|nr:AtpZ/AtpI family protein [Bacteroidales bacterium]